MKTIDYKALDDRFTRAATEDTQTVLPAIRRHLENGTDAAVANVDPGSFAALRGMDRVKTLRAFLGLAEAGAYRMRWAVRCPGCKAVALKAPTLAELSREVRCPICEAQFEAVFDRDVQLSFSPDPAVVKVESVDPFEEAMELFGVEPGISLDIDAGDRRTMEWDLETGNYLVADVTHKAVLDITVRAGDRVDGKSYGYRFRGAPGVRTSTVDPGMARIVLENAMPEGSEFLFARMRDPEWMDAALATSLQEFRDQFPAERPSPSERFPVRYMAFVFAGLRDPVRLCAELGDAAAFDVLVDIVGIVRRVSAAYDGGMARMASGDTMSAFTKPGDAVRAAATMVREFDAYEAAWGGEGSGCDMAVMVGAHGGPCLATSFDGRLGYFGASVNEAAALKGLSAGLDFVLSPGLFADGKAEELVEAGLWKAERLKPEDERPELAGALRMTRVAKA